tara:strand:+ start:1396 stop:1575 length:180 start_codon:yes stop_codon:yes gene_type:complete
MKKIITVIAVVFALTSVNATEPSSRCCKDIYEAIEKLLENKTITIKQAQELWIKHKTHL